MKSKSSRSLLVIQKKKKKKKNQQKTIQLPYKLFINKKNTYNYKNFTIICSTDKISDRIQIPFCGSAYQLQN